MAVDNDDGFWVSSSEAARRLGCSRQAIQKRIARGTIPTMVNNRGERMVKAVAGAAPVSAAPVPVTTVQPTAPVPFQGPRQPLQGVLESVPMSVPIQVIEALQASHNAALAALRGQVERSESQHRETVALLVERIDAAECRAERLEQQLGQVLDALLSERRQPAGQVERVPWWRGWFKVR
jgi:hypothetical protein